MNSFTVYLMLIICVVLVTVDSIELHRLSMAWKQINNIDERTVNECIKMNLLVRTVFSSFSFITSISASFFTILYAIDSEWLYSKFLLTFFRYNYFLFGPLMFAFSCIGLYYWNNVVYECNPNNLKIKFFSLGNSFSLIFCFLISLVILLFGVLYETIEIYRKSIIRQEDGISILRKLLFWVIFRRRRVEEDRDQNNNFNNIPIRNGENISNENQ